MSSARARLALLVVAVLFSTGGVAIKWTDATSWQVASLRSLVAALTLWLLLRPDVRKLNWRVFGVALAYAATMVLFVQGNKLTTAANTIFLQATAPLYLAFLAPMLLGETMRRRDLILTAAMALGLGCVFLAGDVGSAVAPDPARGNLLAALSGISWALTILGLRSLGVESEEGGALSVVVGNFLAFAVCLPRALPLGELGAADGWTIVFLGSIQIGLAYFLLTRAVVHVPALESSLLLLVEPALNPIWTWWLLGERVAPLAMIGGLVILLATAAHVVSAARERLAS